MKHCTFFIMLSIVVLVVLMTGCSTTSQQNSITSETNPTLTESPTIAPTSQGLVGKTPQTFEQWIARGDNLAHSGDNTKWAEALDAYTRADEFDPGIAKNAIASQLQLLGRNEEALAAWDESINYHIKNRNCLSVVHSMQSKRLLLDELGMTVEAQELDDQIENWQNMDYERCSEFNPPNEAADTVQSPEEDNYSERGFSVMFDGYLYGGKGALPIDQLTFYITDPVGGADEHKLSDIEFFWSLNGQEPVKLTPEFPEKEDSVNSIRDEERIRVFVKLPEDQIITNREFYNEVPYRLEMKYQGLLEDYRDNEGYMQA